MAEVKKARLEKTDQGVVRKSDGWFVMHASDAPWMSNERFGSICDFEGMDMPFARLGINVHVVQPGQPACLYHRENAQEAFVVLSGKCRLVIEEQEVDLRAGHFVHCPPRTNHVFVGAGDRPCVILMTGSRSADWTVTYPMSELAAKYGASVVSECDNPVQAYGQSPVFADPAPSAWQTRSQPL